MFSKPISLLISAISFLCFNELLAQANAGLDQEICGQSTVMDANVPLPGESGLWTVVLGNATFVDDTDALTQVDDLAFGENVIQWAFTDINGISVDSVSVVAYDTTIVFAGVDTILALPNTWAQLGADLPPPPIACYWTFIQGTGVIADPTDPYTIVTGLNLGDNIFQWNCSIGPCGVFSDQVILNLFVWTGISSAGIVPEQWVIHDPVQQSLLIQLTDPADQILIFDAQGRVVLEEISKRNSERFSIAGLPNGVYLLRAVVENEAYVYRFMVTN